MRITRVYTRTGDRGETGLVGGRRVPKDHVRIAAVGTVDELNAIIGIARTLNVRSEGEPSSIARIDTMLKLVQNELFNLGADLATPSDARFEGMIRIDVGAVDRLETWCDALNEDVGPLKEFILPGGGPVGAFLHQARTVCRRAEREVLGLMRAEPEVGELPLQYLNRLSDFLFVLGRWAAHALGEIELFWEKPST